MVALWVGGSDAGAAERPGPDAAAGKTAYEQHCARCHGATGRGDGLDAKRFYPRPRDLTLGVYKFRSTVSGTPPTDDDLFHSITNGLPGSNMPDWQHLDEASRWHLVDYLQSLSPVFKQVTPTPVAVAPDPSPTRVDPAKGKAVYATLGCALCHGQAGRANGTSAGGLVDDWGMPIRPANLTKGWNYRGGSSPHAILLRLLTGIDGAGMPSYAEAVSPEEAWQLAYYVASLQEPAEWNMIAHPLAVSGELPMSVDDPRWNSAERTDVPVRNVVTPAGEWASPPTIQSVAFQAMQNGERIAFRFTWDDPTQETGADPDGFALLLKPPGSQGDVVTLQAWPYVGSPKLDLCYWSAGRNEAVETLSAAFNPVTGGALPNMVMSQNTVLLPQGDVLTSASRYGDGRWQMILQRPFTRTSPEGAAAIAADGYTSIAFAVWDGAHPEARAVSPWVEIAIRNNRRTER